MGKLIVNEFLTLDGVMQGPGDPNEDTRDGFAHGGWHLPYFDDIAMGEASKGMAETGAFLFGRRTYEIMAAYWPTAPEDIPFTGILNGLPKYVVSTTLGEPLAWQGSSLLDADVPTAVARLKEELPKNLVVLGSGELVRTLIEHDLVDEYGLTIDPIVLGSGRRLFQGGYALTHLRLTGSKPTSTGSVILTYRPESPGDRW